MIPLIPLLLSFNVCFSTWTWVSWFLLLHMFWNRIPGDSKMGFLWARCPSCHLTISVKAMNGTQNTNPDQWPGLILSPSTNWLLMVATYPMPVIHHYASTGNTFPTLVSTAMLFENWHWHWYCQHFCWILEVVSSVHFTSQHRFAVLNTCILWWLFTSTELNWTINGSSQFCTMSQLVQFRSVVTMWTVVIVRTSELRTANCSAASSVVQLHCGAVNRVLRSI